jgi:hypothetical protein
VVAVDVRVILLLFLQLEDRSTMSDGGKVRAVAVNVRLFVS